MLSGIKLKKISLLPESVLTTPLYQLMSAKKKPPMLLASEDQTVNGLHTGAVLLDDAVFEFLGGPGTLSVNELAGALETILKRPLTAALNRATGKLAPDVAGALFQVLGLAADFVATQFLNPIESGNTSVVEVTTSFPKGIVSSKHSGFTSITGTLDMGDFGKAEDSVLVLVLPTLDSAKVEPNTTVIAVGSPVKPGPTVRTFVETTVIAQSSASLTGRAKSIASFMDGLLPGGLAAWEAGLDKTFVVDTPFGNALKFHVRGKVTPGCTKVDDKVSCAATFTDVGIGFYMPNLIPFVDNIYTIADPTIAAVGDIAAFDTHIEHQHTIGETPMTGTARIPPLGSKADPTAKVIVVDGLLLTKEVAGGHTAVRVGANVGFEITVTNPLEVPVNVQLTDRLFFQSDSAPAETLLSTTTIPIGILQPHESRGFSIPASASPSETGILRNEITAPGCGRQTRRYYPRRPGVDQDGGRRPDGRPRRARRSASTSRSPIRSTIRSPT